LSLSKVANIVLNTHFSVLLLRILRTMGGHHAGGSSRSPSSPCSPSSTAASSASLRLLACTTLALMLRYATFILPPSASSGTNEQIISVLILLLKESPRLDLKLKRKVFAAYGELVFYVTAQDSTGTADETPGKTTSGGGGKADCWALPSGALTVLVRSLKDEPDEVVKHYIVKVMLYFPIDIYII
jgi:hypothetical protein